LHEEVKMSSGIGRQFMEKTQYRHMGPSDQQKGLPQPPLGLAPPQGTREAVDLPALAAMKLGPMSLRQAIEARRSLRQYADKPLSLAELSYLLWCTQGVRETTSGKATFRTVPSAGARHPLETMLLVNRVGGLEVGLYWFVASEHRLVKLAAEPEIADRIAEAAYNQTFILKSAATFIWIADTVRTTWRYGERGYRYMHLDAGHVCQNLYLAAESIGAGCCAIGAFTDETMNELLGLDGVNQFVIYMGVVGKREATA
jgi:SagB-type dehydrogenase family enzyme